MTAPERIVTENLFMEWSEAPWDTAVFGFPVLQINRIESRGDGADEDFIIFEAIRDKSGAGIVSCRLPHDRLRESMLLEDHGFRFIEMVYQPELDIQAISGGAGDNETLRVSLADACDLNGVLDITSCAFRNERFHVDARIDSRLGDLRYCNWVRSALNHPSQRLQVVRDESRIIAFFVTEMQMDGTCYWHLNAVAPDAQGQGYGRRAWLAMIHKAQSEGAKRIHTCITARNHRVLNLYARLGFQFPPPLMTFQWVKKN